MESVSRNRRQIINTAVFVCVVVELAFEMVRRVFKLREAFNWTIVVVLDSVDYLGAQYE